MDTVCKKKTKNNNFSFGLPRPTPEIQRTGTITRLIVSGEVEKLAGEAWESRSGGRGVRQDASDFESQRQNKEKASDTGRTLR